MAGIVVCPKPYPWSLICVQLSQRAKSLGLPEPPGPFIMAGWSLSNDFEKLARWTSTLEWMDQHGVQLDPTFLEDVEWHIVDEISDRTEWQEPTPPLLPWRDTSCPRPDEALVVAALAELKKNWQSVAGEHLASITVPIKFTGLKRRRLLLSYMNGTLPPWGSWVSLAHDRSSFTGFRARVNACIAPLEVDHIDFEVAH